MRIDVMHRMLAGFGVAVIASHWSGLGALPAGMLDSNAEPLPCAVVPRRSQASQACGRDLPGQRTYTPMANSFLQIHFTGDADQQELYRTMMCFGFLGAMYKRLEDARPLLDVAESRLSGDRRKFELYRSMAEASGGQADYAIKTMNERLRRNPDDDYAKVSMGVAMRIVGDPEWRFPIDNVLATSVDQGARKAALDALNPPPRRKAAPAGMRPG